LESNWHRLQINLLADALYQHWRPRTDYFAGGNMFIYYSLQQARNRDYKGPDFFVVKNVDGTRQRRSWIVWQEHGRYPDVIIELLSPTTKNEDLGPKKSLYESTFKTPEYFCVDPDEQSLRGWQLDKTGYVPLATNTQGWLWSASLQLWLGWREGDFQGTHDVWVRFFDPSGTLVPTAEETAVAEHSHAKAERERAEAERERAEAALVQVETERARAEAAEAELARLREELRRSQPEEQ
jgi:Uma2 family endonuclease